MDRSSRPAQGVGAVTELSGDPWPCFAVESSLHDFQLVLGKMSKDGFGKILVVDGFFGARTGVSPIGR